jgi:hypothetical protein
MRSKAIPTWLDRENKDDGSPYLAVEYNQRRFLLNFIDTGIRITAVYTVPGLRNKINGNLYLTTIDAGIKAVSTRMVGYEHYD